MANAKKNSPPKPKSRKPAPKKQAIRETKKLISPSDECLASYALSLANPFNGVKACVPIFPTPQSRKLTVIARGMGSTGTGSVGYITVAPRLGQAYDGDFAYVTTATNSYTDSSTISNIPSSSLAAVNSNSPYTLAEFGSDSNEFKYRLVSAGVRIRYTGTKLNEGGRVRALQSVAHESVSGHESFNSIGLYLHMKERKFDTNWTQLNWMPVERAELDYSVSSNANTNMVISVSSAVAAQPFEYQIACNYEIIGRHMNSMTPSFASPRTEDFLGHLNAANWIDGSMAANAILYAAPELLNYYQQRYASVRNQPALEV